MLWHYKDDKSQPYTLDIQHYIVDAVSAEEAMQKIREHITNTYTWERSRNEMLAALDEKYLTLVGAGVVELYECN